MEKSRSTETILTLTLALLILYLLKSGEHHWLLLAATGIGVTGLLWKWFRFRIHEAWFWLFDKIGFVVSRLLLGIVFMLVVIPFGLMARIFRKDLMFMKKGGRTYYKPRNHKFAGTDLEDPW